MKRIPVLLILTSFVLAGPAMSHAAPVEEIDLATTDDSAVNRARTPVVERTDDGYLDVTCEDATISSILQQFRRATRMNILSSDSTNLARRVSASLLHVPWCTALQSLLGLANFKLDDRNGIWYVSEKTEEEVRNATRYYVLKHASAVDLADLFNGVAMKTTYEERNSIRTKSTVKNIGALQGNAAGSAESGSSAEIKSAVSGKARATAFPNTNLLVLTGPEPNLLECEKIINELDRPVTQVYIEARFIELSSEAMHKLGIKWDQLESWGASVKNIKGGVETSNGRVADYGSVMTTKTTSDSQSDAASSSSSSTISSSATGSKNSTLSSDGTSNATANQNTSDNGNSSSSSSANSSTTENGSSNFAGLVPTEIADALGAGASAASMGWRNASTFSGQLSADDFHLALSAFESLQEGKLFSNPRIIVANGKEARVDMTTKEPNVEVKSDRSGTEGQNLSISTKLETIPGSDRNLFAGEAFFSYGISLSVKPRVSTTGLIAVEVVPTISEKAGEKTIGSGSEIYTRYPIIEMKTINTEFTMKDGATAVIGGLTQTKEQDVDSGIPYLRKIPWIGPKLFGWQSRQKVQNEILVCVTVGIANPETLRKDAGLPTNAVLGREYVEGRRFEPGERPNALKNLQTIDKRPLEEIRADPYQLKDEAIDLEADAKEQPKAIEVLPVQTNAPAAVVKTPAPKIEPAPVKVEATPAKTAAAPVKAAPAPVVKTEPAPVVKAEPAPVVKAESAPVVKAAPAPVKVEATPAKTVPASVKAEPAPTEDVADTIFGADAVEQSPAEDDAGAVQTKRRSRRH